MAQKYGNLTTSKTWNESLAELREEFRRWGVEDFLLPTKAESQRDKKVCVPFALRGTWVNPECSRWQAIDGPNWLERDLRAIVRAVNAARLADQRGLGALMAEATRALALNAGDDPWVILGLLREAEPEDNRRAYRRLLARAHPDHGGDPERFRAIMEAGEKLGFAG